MVSRIPTGLITPVTPGHMHLLFGTADIGKDDRHSGKHLVAVLHHELKDRIGSCNHNVQLYPTVPAAESLCQALPISFLVESRVFDGRGIEVDLPRNPSPHGGFHQGPGLREVGPVMQDEYVLRSGLFGGSRTDQDAQEKAKNHKPYICRKPVGAIT